MEVSVRRLGAEDWELWRGLRLASLRDSPAAFGSTVEREEAFTEDLWRARLGDPGSMTVLASYDGVPAGIGATYRDAPGQLQVVAMWVTPAARGRGVGHRVLDVLREHADEHGLALHLDVATGNETARRSYASYGFVATGETRPLREGSAELVERMVLPRVSGRRGSR